MNQPPIGLVFSYPQGLPGLIPTGVGLDFSVRLTGVGSSTPQTDSAVFHLALDGGSFQSIPMTQIGQDLYEGTFPPQNCAETYRWYISGGLESGEQFFDPPAGAFAPFVSIAAESTEVTLRDEIEGDVSQWTVINENVIAGAWEAVDPLGTLFFSEIAAPNDDASAAAEAVKAFVTQNGLPSQAASLSDLDGGPAYLITPRFDLSGTDGVVSFAAWVYCNNAGTPSGDPLNVEVSNDDGQTWVAVMSIESTGAHWDVESFKAGDYVIPTMQMRVRFGIVDDPNNSLTEAGVDNFQISAFVCDDQPLSIVSSVPSNGSIDARQPSLPDGTNPAGWSSIELSFSGNAESLTAADFSVSVDPPGAAPMIGFVITSGNVATIQFGDAVVEYIPLTSWTTITHLASGSSVRLGYLPADVNGDGTSTPNDVLALIDVLNGVSSRPIHSTDVDRSGVSGPSDILRAIDLLNGAGAYEVFNGISLP
jgi:hypothetical protein